MPGRESTLLLFGGKNKNKEPQRETIPAPDGTQQVRLKIQYGKGGWFKPAPIESVIAEFQDDEGQLLKSTKINVPDGALRVYPGENYRDNELSEIASVTVIFYFTQFDD